MRWDLGPRLNPLSQEMFSPANTAKGECNSRPAEGACYSDASLRPNGVTGSLAACRDANSRSIRVALCAHKDASPGQRHRARVGCAAPDVSALAYIVVATVLRNDGGSWRWRGQSLRASTTTAMPIGFSRS